MSILDTQQPHLLVLEPDHEGRAEGDLLQFQQSKTRIVAAARAMAKAVQCMEEDLFTVVVGSLIDSSTPLDLLRRWGGVVGERDADSLTREQLLQVICARISANVIGTADNKANVAGYLNVLVEAFAPSTVRATMYPDNTSTVIVDVESDPPLPEGVAERGGRIAKIAAPIGLLVSVHEVDVAGKAFDDAARGFDGPVFGRLLQDGFGGRRT